ncbi:MAG: hypothetical protein AAF614_07065 [Chloroflexota bacterium]
MTTAHRQQTYTQLHARLAQLTDAQLLALLDNTQVEDGWGRSETITLGTDKIFVKRVSVTDKEVAHYPSTKNLYGLPPTFNFGLDSVGMGAFRELAASLKVTEWVLSGANDSFPLLYHHRLLPFPGPHQTYDPAWLESYVASWGSSEQVGTYFQDRTTAKSELLLFFEHIPHTLRPWLQENLAQIDWALEQLLAIIDFLHQHGLTHFDAHSDNVLTDGKKIYLADFGLALDRGFDLQGVEKQFFDQHNYYDYGQAISNLFVPIYDRYCAQPETKQQQLKKLLSLPADTDNFYPLTTALFEQIEQVDASGLLPLPAAYRDSVVAHRPVLRAMIAFYAAMRKNQQKNTPFPNDEIRKWLQNHRG